MKKRYFVAGIGTGVGKTLVSALLCKHLKADYFKPIQTGYPPDRDSMWVKQHVHDPITIHPEVYLLKLPASPHLAAHEEGKNIALNTLSLPRTDNTLIIEGAGGLLVPINDENYVVDLITHFQAECILVIADYLGCINHSLLSMHYIQSNNIPFKGIILNGNFHPKNKSAIIKQISNRQIIAEIPYLQNITPSTFAQIYNRFKDTLNVEL